jgi:hypothetical protein
LQTLTGKWRIICTDKVCKTAGCQKERQILRPPGEAEISLLKRNEYGLDVVVLVGQQRLEAGHSLPAVRTMLEDEYNVVISERHVGNLLRVFLALVHGVNADVAPVRERLRQQGKILLSIDGVQFDDTSPVLYVIRDVISREVLYSERVSKRDGGNLAQLLQAVKALGVPIIGVISDKEKALVTAVAEALPGVPHQYCQTHFLKNIIKPMEPDLVELSECVKKVVTDLKQLERELPDKAQRCGASAEELKLVQSLCKAGRAAGKVSGDSILNPAPVKRFERLRKVWEAAQSARRAKDKKSLPLLTGVLSALAVLDTSTTLARRLALQVAVIRKIAHILKFENDSQQIRRQLRTYLNELKRNAPDRGRGVARGNFMRHVVELADRYWPGLFYCYDIEQMPRTNNELEQIFSRLKQAERRATGRKSTAGGPLESCAEFVLEAWSSLETHPEITTLFKNLSHEQLQLSRQRLEDLADPARIKRSIQRDPEKYLNEVLAAWQKS